MLNRSDTSSGILQRRFNTFSQSGPDSQHGGIHFPNIHLRDLHNYDGTLSHLTEESDAPPLAAVVCFFSSLFLIALLRPVQLTLLCL